MALSHKKPNANQWEGWCCVVLCCVVLCCVGSMWFNSQQDSLCVSSSHHHPLVCRSSGSTADRISTRNVTWNELTLISSRIRSVYQTGRSRKASHCLEVRSSSTRVVSSVTPRMCRDRTTTLSFHILSNSLFTIIQSF